MMDPVGRELYETWADAASPWAAWAKPAVFATHSGWQSTPPALPELPPVEWAPTADGRAAIVVDVADGEAVAAGIALVNRGYRPVPLFNGCAGKGMVVDVTGVALALAAGAPVLKSSRLTPDAPPAFLLDSHRRRDTGRASPGRFDNRWVTFPQDFPSARRLASAGVGTVVVYAPELLSDLEHVLLRWQEGGIALAQVEPGASGLRPLTVGKPSRFRALGYRAAVLVGLLRNPAGGFGARVPEPSSSSG